MVTLKGLILGSVTGIVVTVLTVLVWPRRKLQFIRPVVAALLGFGVAYLLMVKVH